MSIKFHFVSTLFHVSFMTHDIVIYSVKYNRRGLILKGKFGVGPNKPSKLYYVNNLNYEIKMFCIPTGWKEGTST